MHVSLQRNLVTKNPSGIMTWGREPGVVLSLVAGATLVAALTGPFPVALVALLAALPMPGLMHASVSTAFARYGIGQIDARSLANARSVVFHPHRRLDTLSEAMLASAGLEVTAVDAEVRVRGLCGSLVEVAGRSAMLRGGVPDLVRAVSVARRAVFVSRALVVVHVSVAIIAGLAGMIGLSAILPAALLILLIAGTALALRDLQAGRHFSAAHMTRLQRRVQRHFEAMFRGI